MKRLFLILVSGCVSLVCIFGQQKEMNVLFVGNSYIYSNNLPHIVSIVSDSTEVHLLTRKSVVGGAQLREHWYGERGLKTRKMITEGDFDVVILQDHSLSMRNHPDSTLKYIALFTDLIHSTGAEVYLFNTWARKKVPQFQEEIDEMYARAAEVNGVKRIPVGEAWQMAMDVRPTVELYTGDGSHPAPLGTLLTACVMVKSITGQLPEKLPGNFSLRDEAGESVILMYMDWLDAEFCLSIANDMIELAE